PFKYAQVITGENFCGRKNLINSLKKSAKSGENLLIIGERRIGKSSLIHESYVESKIKLIYIDLFGAKTASDILEKMLVAVSKASESDSVALKLLKSFSHLRLNVGVDPLTYLPTVGVDAKIKHKADTLQTMITWICNNWKKCTIAFDEFQDVLKTEDSSNILAALRSEIQMHGDNAFIFCGSIRSDMDEIFSDSNSPFFKMAKPLDVGPIEEMEMNYFIKRKFKEGKRIIDIDQIGWIYEICDNISGDIQQVCSQAWDNTKSGDNIDEEVLRESLLEVINHEKASFEHIINSLTPSYMGFLKALAKLGGTSPYSGEFMQEVGVNGPNIITRSINKLVKMRVIFRSGTSLRFVNPFFKHYLRHF
ncbi:MAG: ATP-binding protein, partial [Planctomycetes bacterium]|nr:ATP-binding protein [Planctomycetota bacterium]